MGNKSSRSSRNVRWGDEEEECLVQEFFDRFPEMKSEPRLSGDSAPHGASLERGNRWVSLIKRLKRQIMKLSPFSRQVLRKDELHSLLMDEFLKADKVLDSLLTNMKNVKEELREVQEAILDRTPSRQRQEEMLKKLKQFQSSESFSEQFVQSFRDLMEQHQGIVKLVQRQMGKSLEKKVKKLKWLKKVIRITFAAFFVAVLICSIVVVAVHASPVLVSVVAAASSAASWMPFNLWVDKLWEKKLDKLEEVLAYLQEGDKMDQERVLRELESIFSLVNQLKQGLLNVHSRKEVRSFKGRLQKELRVAFARVNDAIEKVEGCKEKLNPEVGTRSPERAAAHPINLGPFHRHSE